MKIKYKLSAIIFFIILLVSVSNYLVLTQTFESLLVKRLESAEVLLGTNLAQNIYRLVIEDQKDAVAAILLREKVSRKNNLAYLVVNDRTGTLFAHTYITAIPGEISALNNEFKAAQNYRIDDLLETPLDVYNIGVPIREGIIQFGTLHIGIAEDFIVDTVSPLKKAFEKIFGFGLIVVVVGGALALSLSLAITRSLSRLQGWAMNLSQGDYDIEMSLKGNDEVALLAKSFAQMRDNIKEAHNKLEMHNKNLESLVQERTSELERNIVELDEQRNNLKIVFSAMDNPLYVINEDHTIAMMNDVAKNLTTSSSKHQLACHQLIYKSEGPCNTESKPCPLAIIKETKQPVTLEHIHITETGRKKTIEIHAYPIFANDGSVTQIVETCIDVSEKRAAEEERFRLESELSRAHKLESIGTLAAGVAHEINTPIQFIGDNTQFAEDSVTDLFTLINKYKVLLDNVLSGNETDITKNIDDIDAAADLEYLTEELPKSIQQTKDGIKHVSKIVTAMKDFSHIGSDEEMLEEDINQAIETTLTISKNEWKFVADIQRELDENLPLVKCFIGEIKQVILNLIVNAAHAIQERRSQQEDNEEKGVIKIVTISENGMVTIAVSDTGIGIDEKHKGNIFDPFYTTKDVRKGTGQGLSVAYQVVVEKHKGKIWFESERGKGSTFFFTLAVEGIKSNSV